MKHLSLLIMVFALAISSTMAAGPIKVKSINVTNLSKYNGKYVTAFYLSARASGFSYGNTTPRINRVLAKSSPVQIKNGKATIPRATVIESGFNVFNFLKIVIHNSNSNIIIKRIDGTTPPGQSMDGGESRYVKSFYVEKGKLGQLNSPAPATVSP